jgi:hypothetical protein
MLTRRTRNVRDQMRQEHGAAAVAEALAGGSGGADVVGLPADPVAAAGHRDVAGDLFGVADDRQAPPRFPVQRRDALRFSIIRVGCSR